MECQPSKSPLERERERDRVSEMCPERERGEGSKQLELHVSRIFRPSFQNSVDLRPCDEGL